MFKYIRTLNSHVSAPETVKVPIKNLEPDFEYSDAGCIFTRTPDGYFVPFLDNDQPKYLALEPIVAASDQTEVNCIRLTPGMVLEADCFDNDTKGMANGACLCYSANEDNGLFDRVHFKTGEDLEIWDISRVQQESKILVVTI